LYVVDVDEKLPEGCRVTAWRPEVPLISEVCHSLIVGHRYPPHTHDTWTVLIVDAGALRYDLERRVRHGADGGTVVIVPPGALHDCGPARDAGHFHKRNLYLDPAFLPARLTGPAVDRSTLRDRALWATLATLHDRLAGPGPEPLDVEARLALVAERLRRRLEPGAAEPPEPPCEPVLAARMREFFDGRLTTKVTLADAGAHFGRTVPHLVRSFTRRYGLSPHAYVIGARVERARGLLLDGMPPAQVATEVGFHDQAHLTRHFKRHVSVPPARYAAHAGRRRSGW
jgi:AraC-like DNA-binding protein